MRKYRIKQGTQNTIGSTLFCFWKSKQMICLLEGWIRQKTRIKCKQMYFIPQMVQLIFEGLNINNKQCSTFTFMYLGIKKVKAQKGDNRDIKKLCCFTTNKMIIFFIYKMMPFIFNSMINVTFSDVSVFQCSRIQCYQLLNFEEWLPGLEDD